MRCGKYSQRHKANLFSAACHVKASKWPENSLAPALSLIFCGYFIDSAVVKLRKIFVS